MKNKTGIFYGFWARDFDVDYVALTKKVAELGFEAIELVTESVRKMTPVGTVKPEKSRGKNGESSLYLHPIRLRNTIYLRRMQQHGQRQWSILKIF